MFIFFLSSFYLMNKKKKMMPVRVQVVPSEMVENVSQVLSHLRCDEYENAMKYENLLPLCMRVRARASEFGRYHLITFWRVQMESFRNRVEWEYTIMYYVLYNFYFEGEPKKYQKRHAHFFFYFLLASRVAMSRLAIVLVDPTFHSSRQLSLFCIDEN